MSYGYNDSFAAPAPVVQVQKVGGWKALAGATVAALGIGFAGFVYLGPFMKVTKALQAQTTELDQARGAADELTAERDKLKVAIGQHMDVEQEKTASDAKHREAMQALTGELKAALPAAGVNISPEDARLKLSFAVTALFEQPFSIGVSPAGDAALKALAAAMKKNGLRAKVKAKLIQAPPPRELGQFKAIAEFEMLRAARVLLVLSSGGAAADHLTVAGELPGPGARKGRGGVPDRVDVEIEPE
ncbi:MAG TPA: hypothetical protein VHU40_20790 [Polyangia bacterium]|jgi:hypothetical protein|nr:hypothetical protein [Polyangia bacterium]